ncbi:MAG: PAS domain S-box protein, partial [Alphaproteobacteria bacterium]
MASKRFLKSAKKYGSIGATEGTFKASSGFDTPVEFSAGIWQSDGVLHLGVILRDIKERKRREASFQMLFERNPVPMWIFDANTYAFVAVNEAACELYGHSASQMLKRSVLDIRLPHERKEALENLRSVGEAYEAAEPCSHMTASGRKIRVLPFARRIQYGGKECILSAIIDVTERERASIE